MGVSSPVCGDCATYLLRAGALRSPATTIGLGTPCAIHPSQPAPHATSVFDLVDPSASARALRKGGVAATDAPPAPTFAADEPLICRDPRCFANGGDMSHAALERERTEARKPAPAAAGSGKIGPITEIATALLVAWSQGDAMKADPLAVENAVITAKRLYSRTNGA